MDTFTTNSTTVLLFRPTNAMSSSAFQAVFTALVCLFVGIIYRSKQPRVDVPSIGAMGFLGFYYGSMKFIFGAGSMIEEGHKKFEGRTFKIPELGKWRVIVTKPNLIEEVRKLPEDIMSFRLAVKDVLAADLTIGTFTAKGHFHIDVVRSQFPRNFSDLFPDIVDELVAAFDEAPFSGTNGWSSFPALDTLTRIVVRITNRILVGKPLCRNNDFLDLMQHFTEDIMKAAAVMSPFPSCLKPYVCKYLTPVPSRFEQVKKHMQPVVDYRIRQQDQFGLQWDNKPNDVLSWLIDEATGEKRSIDALTQYILTTNIAAVHTTAMTLTHTLYQLAVSPQYVQTLRDEVTRTTKEGGYTKLAFSQMRLLDSFIKESMRFHGVSITSTQRLVMRDYTLSDGTFLPAGTYVACTESFIHRDGANYEDAHLFKPFRFVNLANMHKASSEEIAKASATATSPTFLAFSHGKRACPGRFFAISQIKAIMAYILLHYDVKLADGDHFPKDFNLGLFIVPNPKAMLSFRRTDFKARTQPSFCRSCHKD